VVAASRIPVLDLAANYGQLSDQIAVKMQPSFEQYGLEVLNLLIENISVPPEVEQAMDRRASMGVVGIGNLPAYAQFQTANSIPDAARNPGGLAALGAGFGMGAMMAGQVGQALAPGAVSPPPLPGAPAAGLSFYIGLGGQRLGPLDLQALNQQVLAGQLTPQTLVWRAGMAQWTPAGQTPELAALFQQVPPPLPASAPPPK
jgi:hypothetical protein